MMGYIIVVWTKISYIYLKRVPFIIMQVKFKMQFVCLIWTISDDTLTIT
jgi:hypothetical protein